MNENISLRKLKVVIKSKGMTLAEMAKRCGEKPAGISMLCTGRRIPKTDLLAKICSILEVYPSEIVTFDGIKVNEIFFTDDKREPLPKEFKGELTYKPLWLFLVDYLSSINKNKASDAKDKTANDLFNQIEPPRRLAGYKITEGISEKAVAARFGEGYKSERVVRTDYSKGLHAATRVKLRNDRPLNLSVIYEICKKLGCTIDFVMSYK